VALLLFILTAVTCLIQRLNVAKIFAAWLMAFGVRDDVFLNAEKNTI
jgi:hypothetical protein